MERSFWEARWREGRLGFHRTNVNPHLRTQLPALTGGRRRSILVPLCGKTVDMAWLASQGHDVTGVEFVESGARDFFKEQKIDPRESSSTGHPVLAGADVAIHVADFLQLDPEVLARTDAVWDRAALIALPPEQRLAYAHKLTRDLAIGTRMLLVTIEYDESQMQGPPFSVDEKAVHGLFEEGWRVEQRDCIDTDDLPPRFRAAGIPSVKERVWLIERV